MGFNFPGHPGNCRLVRQQSDLRHGEVHFGVIIDFPVLGNLLGSLVHLGEAWRVIAQKLRQVLFLIGLPYPGQHLGQLALQRRRRIHRGLGSNRGVDLRTGAGLGLDLRRLNLRGLNLRSLIAWMKGYDELFLRRSSIIPGIVSPCGAAM